MAVQNDSSPNRGNRKKKWALGAVLFLIVMLCIGLWQKNNIEAFFQYNKYTQEELEQQLQSNDQSVDEMLQAALDAAKEVDAKEEGSKAETEADPPEVTDPDGSGNNAPVSVPETPKTEQSPSKPEGKPQDKPPTAQQPSEKPPAEQPPAETGPTYEQQLKAIADKVYALKDEYLSALDSLQAEAIAAYKALPTAKRTGKELASFVSTYLSKASALERQCDGKMDVLVSELTQLQKKYGQSMELVDQVKYTYANEKSLKKAWYMAELQKRGFI